MIDWLTISLKDVIIESRKSVDVEKTMEWRYKNWRDETKNIRHKEHAGHKTLETSTLPQTVCQLDNLIKKI